MARKRFKVPTWEEGRELMQEIGGVLSAAIEEQDEYLVCESGGVRVSMFPDDRGFAFFMVTYSDEGELHPLESLIGKYLK